jgi:hypothetical protein
MQIFLANKGMMMNVGLDEIKKMTPEEMYIFLENLKQIEKEMEIRQNGI